MEWFLVVLALFAWGWYSGAVAKETAVRVARRACERHGQQLLDETVTLVVVRPRRDRSGRVRLWRRYGFEFSADGERRQRGELELLGRRLVATNLELDGFVLYEQAPDEQQPPEL